MNGKIWESVQLGSVTVKNRIAMPPMSTRLSNTDGSVTQRLIDYYEARAQGGVGLIIVEYSYIDNKASKAAVCQLGVHSDDLLPGLNELAERLHLYDTKVFLQICHGGGQSPSRLIKTKPVAPSPVPSKTGEIPTQLTIENIVEIRSAFSEAALRAKKAGFDGIEIHGAHGYLINQFLSPIYNRRTDEYGFDFVSRCKFPLEVVSEIRKLVGKTFPIGFRLNVRDYMPGGIELDESLRFIRMLEDAGVDYIHASAGTYLSHQYMISPIYIPRGHLEDIARKCKGEVKIPVIAVGGIDHKTAVRILENGSADLVAIGRALVADPQLPNKLKHNRTTEIRPCIRCNIGCIGRFFEGKTMRCATNPHVGRESAFVVTPAEKRKKVLVIGGGVAGMEVARTASQRGHQVTLIEKSDSLGGNVLVAAVPNFKAELGDLVSWYTNQLTQLEVDIKLNYEATPDSLNSFSPEVVVIACGANYAMPPIKKIEDVTIMTATEALKNPEGVGQNVVIIGAGLVGVETAMFLWNCSNNRKITVIDSLPEIMWNEVQVNRLAVFEKLQNMKMNFFTSCKITTLAKNELKLLDSEGKSQTLLYDTVVLAAGFVKNPDIEKLIDSSPGETFTVGDCKFPGRIYDAINSAADLARKI